MVAEALSSSFTVEHVYRKSDIGEKAMSRISMMSSPSPVLAVVRMPEDTVIEDIMSMNIPSKGLFLALDGIRDPGNLGTILRIADWFGIDGVFASPDTVELFNPKAVQASMGAIFRVRFNCCGLEDLCSRFAASGAVYGTFLDGEDIYSKNLSTGEDSPSLIVVGNESNGISAGVAARVTDRLYIPSYPRDERGSESLNAAVAAAVTVAEFRRRTIQ